LQPESQAKCQIELANWMKSWRGSGIEKNVEQGRACEGTEGKQQQR
jgi:hypothetical protein